MSNGSPLGSINALDMSFMAASKHYNLIVCHSILPPSWNRIEKTIYFPASLDTTHIHMSWVSQSDTSMGDFDFQLS